MGSTRALAGGSTAGDATGARAATIRSGAAAQ
jgi:hypothetical protein